MINKDSVLHMVECLKDGTSIPKPEHYNTVMAFDNTFVETHLAEVNNQLKGTFGFIDYVSKELSSNLSDESVRRCIDKGKELGVNYEYIHELLSMSLYRRRGRPRLPDISEF